MILSRRFPFFSARDDMHSLAEILHIVGVNTLEDAAGRLMRIITVKGYAGNAPLVSMYL